ncbi:hypothetical protein LG943_27280 [Streptomonospora sp. S1-112]|uniref:Uncharacterized protein n=1 Tax=Streptomonospora mangrovi TaxID=2883123 RepID=A0A9X3NQF3_9ACTN|nr:hypothetical protein [Streptomonospora mangrovi]MDA0567994.1 hypothetical protein [Streptomonospora mangrovi]
MPDRVDALLRDLTGEDRGARRAAAPLLADLGAPVVERLLPLCADGASRYSPAESVLHRIGEAALLPLREVRRRGPGRLRRTALRLLVDLGGAECLAEADRRAVERLVRIRLAEEGDVRLPSDAGRWLAFPADRFDDAVAALDLHGLTPATVAMGVAAATAAENSREFRDAQGATATAYRVFITPEFENWQHEGPGRMWRLVWGDSFVDELDGFTLADRLSRRCGEAHFYGIDPYHSAENWYVSREGRGVRGYSTYADPPFFGDPLPFEAGEDEDSEGTVHASTAAFLLSVEPGPMSAHGTRGHGWLATTRPEVPLDRFRGALPV